MAHIHEKIDFTASVYIVQDGRVLLHKHKKIGAWLQVGGHIELDEDPNQAALREAKEESGFDVELVGSGPAVRYPQGSRDLVLPMYLNRHRFNDVHEHIDFTYFARIIGGTLQPEEEGDEIRWFTREEVEHNEIGLFDVTRAHALEAIDYFARQR